MMSGPAVMLVTHPVLQEHPLGPNNPSCSPEGALSSTWRGEDSPSMPSSRLAALSHSCFALHHPGCAWPGSSLEGFLLGSCPRTEVGPMGSAVHWHLGPSESS